LTTPRVFASLMHIRATLGKREIWILCLYKLHKVCVHAKRNELSSRWSNMTQPSCISKREFSHVGEGKTQIAQSMRVGMHVQSDSHQGAKNFQNTQKALGPVLILQQREV